VGSEEVRVVASGTLTRDHWQDRIPASAGCAPAVCRGLRRGRVVGEAS
jgi:hypothetical protein